MTSTIEGGAALSHMLSAKEFATVYIVVAINGESVPVSETVPIKDIKPEDAVRVAVTHALSLLGERVAALQPLPIAGP